MTAPTTPLRFSDRRFWPLFVTQFGAALNDNVYKSALLMLFTYSGLQRWSFSIDEINNLVAVIMIVPFILFATSVGQFADKYDKTRLIRYIKSAEVIIMLAGGLALWLQSPLGLLIVLFFTGTQSACFSPLKYSIVPQLVERRELTDANGFLHMGTSLSIFLGLILGSFLVQLVGGAVWVFVATVTVAVVGWWASRHIVSTAPGDQALPIHWNWFSQVGRCIVHAWKKPIAFWAIVGISWYWFVGSVYLTQVPNFSRTVLSAEPLLVTLLLVLFLVGVCSGALLCRWCSRCWNEHCSVCIGGVLLALGGFDLAYTGNQWLQLPAAETLRSLSDIMSMFIGWRVALDIVLVGLAGGLYVVPLAVLMQTQSADESRAQVVAANNFFNAIFMVLAGVAAGICLGKLQQSIPDFFLLVSVAHCVMLIVMIANMPILRRSVGFKW